MGTRINVAKKDDDTPRCHCGKPLPCPQHTGDDGDAQGAYEPEEFKGNEGNRKN